MTSEPTAANCTLDPTQRVARQIEWADVAGLAQSSQRLSNGVRSTFDLSLEAAIRGLAEREQQCCGSWLRAVATVEAGAVTLEVTTDNADGLPLIYSMAALSPEADG